MVPRVKLYDLAKLYLRRRVEIDGAIQRVLESGRVDWGDEVPCFESELAAWLGAKYCVTVNSGTAALRVALLALGVGRGDEVILTPNVDIASSSAVRSVGADIVWVDVDPVTLTMDLGGLRAAIGPRTSAVMPIDLFGHPARLMEILDIAHSKGLAVVEDACLALGASIGNHAVGTISDITCFSFTPSKHLGAYGSGGACVTADLNLADRMRKLSRYGQARVHSQNTMVVGEVSQYETDGLNERLDEIQAAVLRVKLPDLTSSLASRIRQAHIYTSSLSSLAIETPVVLPEHVHAFRNFVVHSDNRDILRARLAQEGIESALSYSPPMHLQPAYSSLGLKEGAFPNAENSCRRLIGLPIGPHLEDAQIGVVVQALRDIIGQPES